MTMNNSLNKQAERREFQKLLNETRELSSSFVLLEDFDQAEKKRIMDTIGKLDRIRELINSQYLNDGIDKVIDAASEYASKGDIKRSFRILGKIGDAFRGGNPIDALFKVSVDLKNSIEDLYDVVLMSVRTKNLAGVVKKVAAAEPDVANLSLQNFISAAKGNTKNLKTALQRAFTTKSKFMLRSGVVKNVDGLITDIMAMPMKDFQELLKIQFPSAPPPAEQEEKEETDKNDKQTPPGEKPKQEKPKGEEEKTTTTPPTKSKVTLPPVVNAALEKALTNLDPEEQAAQKRDVIKTWKKSINFALQKAINASKKEGNLGKFTFTESLQLQKLTLKERYVARKSQKLFEDAEPQGLTFTQVITKKINDLAGTILDDEIANDISAAISKSLEEMTYDDLVKQAQQFGLKVPEASAKPETTATQDDSGAAKTDAVEDKKKDSEPAPETKPVTLFDKVKEAGVPNEITSKLEAKMADMSDEDKKKTQENFAKIFKHAIETFTQESEGGNIKYESTLRKKHIIKEETYKNRKFDDDHLGREILKSLKSAGLEDLYGDIKKFLISKNFEEITNYAKKLSVSTAAPVAKSNTEDEAKEVAKELAAVAKEYEEKISKIDDKKVGQDTRSALQKTKDALANVVAIVTPYLPR